MKKIFTLCVVLCLSYLSMGAANLKHEFRATWLTTAWGNDWPKTKVTNDATRKQQQDSLIAIFDRLQAGNMNAVCLQVRGRSDAFYQSSYEPWAAELAGARGKDPGYDPLAFAIEEAHKRGLELHAWVNPFRVTSAGTLDANDLVKKNAGQWIIQYNNGSFTGEIIDPGYPEAREYVLNVLMEIISNYDIDGIVMDDYFYPYGGTTTEDAASKALHKPANVVDVNQDSDTDDDWRRSNVDVFLKELYDRIQAKKPWVRFGMGTFGIWTTQTKVAQAYGIALPSGISGLDDYDEQACNPVEWVKNGYVDYINPQLYWPTTSTGQNYNKLCQWWAKDVCEHFSNQLTNGKKVHFFSSQSISSNSAVSEIQAEIDANRNNLSSGSTGSVFFDTDAYLTMDKDLMTSRFATNALTPPMDWKSNTALAAPTNLTVSGSTLTWQHATAERFTVYVYPKGTAWSTAKNDPSYLQGVIYGNSMDISGIDTNMNDIAVCAYDRFGVEHTAAVYSNDSGAGTTPNPETIIWELNGGEVNTVTVEVPSLTTLEAQFKNDYNSYFDASVATTREITNFLYYGSKEEGGSNLVYNMMNDPVADWTWLRDYIISKSASNTTIQTALLAGTDAHWRYSIVAFLTASAGTNSTYTVDFSIAGQPSKWGTAYQIAHGAVLLPTYVTSAYTLPTPVHPSGYEFLGWYDNAEFAGSPLTTIPANWTGTLFAQWQENAPTIDPTWQILYTSTDGNIVTPYATDVFGANIVSNTYENGVGTITFDGPVTSIGGLAFYYCHSLNSITIPNSVTSIGNHAFLHTFLSSIAIPNSVTSIGDLAFCRCKSLTAVTIPHSVISIGANPFDGCSGLVSIVVEEGNMMYDSRNDCKAIVETATNTLIAGCQNTVIPNNITSIGNYAFGDCTGLTSVTIPYSVKSIGIAAFANCSSLSLVIIPRNVTSIGVQVFNWCSSLTSIVVEEGNSVYDSRENCNAIIETATNILIAGCQNTIVPNNVTGFGFEAFRGHKGLTSIIIPNKVTSIEQGTFWECSSLTSITIPNSVTSIGESAFYVCSSLTSITIPNSVTSIGESAFGWCSSLTSLTIPNSVTSIGEGAFEYCSSLDTIHVKATTPPTLGVDVFTSSPLCYIPCGTLAAYEVSDWASQVGRFEEDCVKGQQILYTSTDGNIVTPNDVNVFGANIVSNTYDDGQGIIVFDGPVTSIGYEAFFRCSSLTSITIPNGVTSIGDRAFHLCTSLTSVTLPNSVTSIGDYAFYQCISLTSITLPNSVTRIGNSAFEYSSLTSITLPNSVTSIGDRAFSGCDSLISIVVEDGNATYDSRTNCNAIIETATNTLIAGCQNTIIPNSVTSIGSFAFFDRSSLTSITIPNSVTSIGSYAFGSCSSLTSITIPNNVTTIGKDAFWGCKSLTSITIPNSVTSIGSEAFSYCPSLTSIVVASGNPTYDSRENCNAIINTATNTLIAGCQNTIIPNSVTSIGEGAFSGCSSLTSITIPNSVTSIGSQAFSGCSSLTSITIPNSVTSIGEGAFRWCSSLTSITIPNSVTSIGETAFGWCSSLTSITIPNSVTSIGEGAFSGCSSLTSITIPNSVTSIGSYAFDGCSSLDTIYVEATTPPALEDSTVFMNTPSPTCYIPCGTLAVYEASDWASQVSSFVEDCPPASAAITYVLNGGVQSEWETPQAMYNELNALWNTFSGTSKTWGDLSTLKVDVAKGIPTLAYGMALDFIADENFKEKFEWLVTYMDAKCTEQGQTLPSSDASFLRYNLQAFFIDGMRISWPISADYTICGVSTVEAYQPYWKSGFANPTNPTEVFVLNAPYKEGYTFAGWYTNANFSGDKVTTINSETTGTLYAKWVEYIPTIAEVWNMEEGVETKISGVVNWVRYGNVFIQDITGGFRVYIPNDSTRLIPEVGTKIIAKGIRGSFAGSPQLNDAVIESSEPATLAEPIVTTLTDLCANPLKYFGQRVSVQGVYVAEYDSYGNIYVAERGGSNKVKGHYMVVDPIAFPVGTNVSITAVASQYDGAFQFEGDIAGIELAPGPKRDTYEYPVRNEKYTLTNDWVISNIEGNFAANKPAPTDSWFVRGMAAKDGIMYFINRETQSLIRVDGATGHMLDPIKITGEHLFEVYDEEMGEWKSDVIYGYNDIKFDQAGNCLIGACTTGGATRCQTFFIYIVDLETGVCTKLIEDVLWDNPSLDQVQFRFDAFGVAGDVTKNGVVMAADAQSWNVYRWLIKNGVVGDGEQINCALNAEIDESLFIETENFGTAPQIFPQDELGELFYVDGASTLPMLFDGDGMLLDDFINVPTGRNVWNNYGDTISINSGHLNGLIEFQVGEEYFLLMAATYSTHNVPSTFALYKFADENRAFSGMEPLWYFPHNGMGSNTNGYRTAVPSVDVIDNNTAKLYLYVGENGYACYTLNVGDNTAEPIDPTWQITYTSTNDSIVTPYNVNAFDANIVSNIYENGVGTITFDGPITSIGGFAFDGCSNLASLTIPNSITNIGRAAFQECSSLTSITIPNSVTSIGDFAFGGCSSLTSITIPNSVISIGERAFVRCYSLTAITIPNSVTNIGESAFTWCSSLDFIIVEEGNAIFDSRNNCNAIIETITNTLVQGCSGTTIPNSVINIGDRAFAHCNIISIIIPKNVMSIGYAAFGWCENLETVHIESTTPPILDSTWTFSPYPICYIPCGSLAAYEASAWATQVSEFIEEGCPTFQMCGDDLYWEYADGVLTITGTGDMYDYAADTDVPWYDVRDSIKTINMPNEMTKIGDYTFYRCTALTSISLPEQLKHIGNRAFAQDTKIAGEVVIPEGVTDIADRAFYNCNKVNRFTLLPLTSPTLGEKVFESTSASFYISCEAMDDYKVATNWSKLKSRFVDACLNIYHYNTALGANGVYATEETLVAGIYYRRLFTPNVWETLYLPFEVDRVTVLEDGVEYDLNAWSIFSGGHYYLAKPYGIENKEIVFGFTQVVDAHTPYIIQFKEPYYHDKMITFHGKESWNKLNTSFEALPISFEMQMAGNTTLQDQILEEPVYMLRATSNFILQNTTTTLHPFECYVIPSATSSGAPARMSVRFRGDVPTAVESVMGNESRLAYTINGNTLTVYPQGQAFSIYSLNGALIYSCEAGKEAVDCELNSGCYLLHAGTEAHKIML